jgi:jumonji domain-containing protein 2
MISDTEIPLSKILRPTMEEFANFDDFVENLDHDKLFQNYGLVKVIPPKNWKARKTNVVNEFENLSVNAPIEQNVQGKSGIYELLLIQKKSMKLNEYRKKVECFDSLTNNKQIEEVEEMFWKNIAFSPPLYGADMMGTLFDPGVTWNLNELPGVLREGLKNPISGVNNPYLYVGSWKTMFGWHKEDLDLYSINYLHYGKPKFWYCLPASEGKKIENFARTHFPEGFGKCKEFLRHKTIMIHPYILKQKIPDLKIHKMVQNPGEFILTIGGAYHAGFNWGFNIAEAVNFATTKWLEIFPNVSSCHCITDSVKMDKVDFYANMLQSPIYGKLAAVKKVCHENGVTKSKLNAMKIEQEEVESTETADSRDAQPMRKPRSRTREKDKMEVILSGDAKIFDKNKRPYTTKRGRTINNKSIDRNDEIEDEERTRLRISNRSKKIKKLGEEFETVDWKKMRRTRSGKPLSPIKKGNLKNKGSEKKKVQTS